jgi:Asp/Glu/Hydantoin racemase
MPRIALIHALAHSVAPINAAFERDWPAALRMNLLDDSLSADLARSGAQLDAAMHARFAVLGDYAVSTGADALLFTCSAFGPCIEAVARRHAPRPVLKPNEAMIDEAVRLAGTADPIGHIGHIGRIGLIASFAPTLQSMPAEFPAGTALDVELAVGALDALDAGDTDQHDRRTAEAAQRLQARGCTLIALAQFSLARAAPAVRAATGLPVLTTVDSAVAALRRRLGA